MGSALETTVPDSKIPSVEQASTLAIVFADVCGSTRLYELHGDAKARKMIGRCIDLMTESTGKHGGRLIKTIGDEVMCSFPTADDAAAAALDMQEQVSGASMTGGGGGMAIHVGFHFGPVVLEHGDVYGDAVNLASRMVNLSKRDQILTTAATVAQLSPEWQKATRQVDRAAVRGKTDEIDVYELIWQEADVTRIAGKTWVLPQAGQPEQLILHVGAREIELNKTHPSVTAGRGEQNDLVFKDEMVSRLHARIDYRNQRFALTDQSVNGTWVAEGAGPARLVRHDTQVLSGAGTISFGHAPQPGEPGQVRYETS